MSDSLLVEALEDTRVLLSELDDDDDDPTTRMLRERVDLLDRVSISLRSRALPARHLVPYPRHGAGAPGEA